jgi:hypothetical protein
MTLQFQQEIPDSDVLLTKVIKDLETGAEYPYRDLNSALTVIQRVAKTDGCSASQALETLWVLGMEPEEFVQVLKAVKVPR